MRLEEREARMNTGERALDNEGEKRNKQRESKGGREKNEGNKKTFCKFRLSKSEGVVAHHHLPA